MMMTSEKENDYEKKMVESFDLFGVVLVVAAVLGRGGGWNRKNSSN